MKIKKSTKPGQCWAMRCQEPATIEFAGTGHFCDRHAEEALPAYDAATRSTPGPATTVAMTVVDDAPSSLAVPGTTREDLAKHAEEAREYLALLETFAVVDDQTLAIAKAGMKEAHDRHKALDDERKSVTSALRAAEKEWNAAYAVATGPWSEVKKGFGARIDAHSAAQKEQSAALFEAACDLQGAEKHVALVAASVAADTGIKEVTYWHYEVVDPALVPEEYWILDEKKIGQVVREAKREDVIPGIRAFGVTKARV